MEGIKCFETSPLVAASYAIGYYLEHAASASPFRIATTPSIPARWSRTDCADHKSQRVLFPRLIPRKRDPGLRAVRSGPRRQGKLISPPNRRLDSAAGC